MRYPKANLEKVERAHAPIELGKAEVWDWGEDAMIIAFGSLFPNGVKAAQKLREEGLRVGVINARFARPLDNEALLKAIDLADVVVTIEEGTLQGGFGSAVLESANAAGADTRHLVRLGIPDQFIEHAERGELLATLGLDVNGICAAIRQRTAAGREMIGS